MSAVVDSGPHGQLTAEQARAVERREGPLIVTANAGAGKTMVLVERFVRDVLESAAGDDPIGCDQILAITFTRKAAGELRERIRERFSALGARQQAREVERAWILTIDGFCLRVLRAHAVLAGLDPEFTVLDQTEVRQMRESAFAQALDDWLGDGGQPRAVALHVLAAHGYDGLLEAITEIHESLRSAGSEQPAIPQPEPADRGVQAQALARAAGAALAELRAAGCSGQTVGAAAEALEECVSRLAAGEELSPETVRGWKLPRTAKALKTPAFDDCRAAIDAYARVLEDEIGAPQLALIAELLDGYGEAFGALKRQANGLDFTDLALHARALLRDHPAVAAAYRRRLRRVMVDEFQDTNALQVSLIEALGVGDVFMVGDALQSIYGFRHADVDVFIEELERRRDAGESGSLAANFRSRRAILDVVNAAFADAHDGVPWTALAVPEHGGRDERDPSPDEPVVELLLTDERAWNEDEAHRGPLLAGLPPATRPAAAAEALLVAQRVRELVDCGEAQAGEIVVLVRAGTKLPLFERAIERAGLAAVAAQGRGWWARLEVLDLMAHLRVLVNPRDEDGLCGALAAFAGVSHDTLALLAMDRDEARRGGDRFASLMDAVDRAAGDAPSDTPVGPLEGGEREILRRYLALLESERAAAAWAGPAELLARVVAATGYDTAALERPGGARRLANVRKLVRLAGDFERRQGGDLRAFVDHAAAELDAKAPTSDAPVEVGLDSAVRLMTIHAAKGLEFPVVVVADLGHRPPGGAPRVLVDGERAGLRVTTLDRRRFDALDYGELKRERARRERGEERRVVHVAVTRAERRLVLSGVVDLEPGDGWDTGGKAVAPARWMAPLLLDADVLERLPELVDEPVTIARHGARGELRVAVNAPRTVGSVLRLGPGEHEQMSLDALNAAAASREQPARPAALSGQPEPPPPPATVSYTSLTEYARCGYRWYLERILRLPRREAWDLRDVIPPAYGEAALRRGTIAHLLLERQSLVAGAAPPDAEAVRLAAREAGAEEPSDEQVADQQRLVAAFLDGPLRGRLAAAERVEREVAFSLALAPGDSAFPMLTGSIDLLAYEPGGSMLVVDYKTDRVEPDASLGELVDAAYGLQRAAYALACLRAGAPRVDVAHVYLERRAEPVLASYAAQQLAALEAELLDACAGLSTGRFEVSDRPYAGLCATCPGRGGLCSHPDELTGRAAP